MTDTATPPRAPTLIPGDRRPALLRVVSAARPVGWRLLLAALLGALAIGSSVGLLAASAFLISKAALHPPILELGVAIVAVRAFGIGRGVFRYAERLFGHDAAFRSLTDLRLAMFDRLSTLAPAGARLWRGGDLLSRLVADVDSMLDLYLRVLLPYLVAVMVGSVSVLLVALFVPAAAVALAVALLVGGVLVPALSLRSANRSQRMAAPAVGALTADTVTMLDGAAEFIALGEPDRMLELIRAVDAELTTVAARGAKSNALSAAIGALAQGGAVVAALILGTQAVTTGALDGVSLALVVFVPLAAYEAVQALPSAILCLARVRTSAERIVEIVDADDPVPDPAEPCDLPDVLTPGRLCVVGLSAGWEPGRWVVEGVNLTLEPGSSTALVGPSGSGKSTVAAAIARFAPSQGRINFDGQDIRTLSGDDVRRIVGVAPQDCHLFDTTIAENVRLARRSATDGEISEILDELGLGPWLESLPNGLGTDVGRFGRSVSAGQRQRIGLARVLVSEQPVVVVDEPTEHLDADSAELVIETLRRRCSQRALLVISHREADVASCDHVVRLPPRLSGR
ncbi:MAG: thiol reductant ABC exporter subunit CydC [Candidatus Nanopelagicales bacterium]|nr:thiol reductant ABC exporter subunit CydC [Candidatus Nanopelagicales bacterium]